MESSNNPPVCPFNARDDLVGELNRRTNMAKDDWSPEAREAAAKARQGGSLGQKMNEYRDSGKYAAHQANQKRDAERATPEYKERLKNMTRALTGKDEGTVAGESEERWPPPDTSKGPPQPPTQDGTVPGVAASSKSSGLGDLGSDGPRSAADDFQDILEKMRAGKGGKSSSEEQRDTTTTPLKRSGDAGASIQTSRKNVTRTGVR